MESIPFHPIVNQDKSKTPTPATDPLTQQTQLTATTQTVIRKAIFKLEPKHPHPKSKTLVATFTNNPRRRAQRRTRN